MRVTLFLPFLTMIGQDPAQAGPSHQRRPRKSKQSPKHVNAVKAKKISEKQKIEGLEREALTYVSRYS